MGLGMKASIEQRVMPKPMAAVLSFSGTQRTETKKLEALPLAPTNFRQHITAKKATNCVQQLTGQDPGMAWPFDRLWKQ